MCGYLCIQAIMDTIEKVKIAWKEKFGSEIPHEFVTRVECELSKLENNLEDNSIQLYNIVKSETKLKIEELSKVLRNEEYFYELVSNLTVEGNNQCKPGNQPPVYAKVNKPVNNKESESDQPDAGDYTTLDDRASSRHSSMSDQSPTYEEIEINNYKGDNLIKPKTKARGSVKARIKMFERSDSSSGEEVAAGAEGEYARLVLKHSQAPPVSPKPSPAVRRKPKSNDYEEIRLPGLALNPATSTGDKDTNSSSSGQTQIAGKHTPNSLSSKQESCQADNSKTLSNQPAKVNTSVQGKKPAPPVPLRRSRGNECVNSGDSDVLKKTEDMTLQYSEHEPQLATSRKQRCTDEVVKLPERIRPDDIHVHKRVDRHSDGIEGDYCAITDLKKPTDKHVTLVQVTSSNEKPKSGALLNVKKSERELSKSHDNLNKIQSGSKRLTSSGSVSKSLEDFKQIDDDMKCDKSVAVADDNDDDNDYTDIAEVAIKIPEDKNMKKIFHRRNSGSITSEKQGSEENQEAVVGTRYKSLSGSESEEDLLRTVVVNVADMVDRKDKDGESVDDTNDGSSPDLSDSDSKPESEASKSPEVQRVPNRKRVPDYEKWTFQHLLTKTGISIADNDNLTDTGSEDENIYDNNSPPKHEFQEQVTGQSDDSGVLVTESSPDSKDEEQGDTGDTKPPTKCPSGDAALRMSTACKLNTQLFLSF